MIPIETKKIKSVQSLINITNETFNCDITRRCRKQEYVAARAMCYYLIRKYIGLSYQQIGDLFNKNHATVLHAVKEWPYMVKYNTELSGLYEKIYGLWSGDAPEITEKTCQERIKDLEERIKLLTLQLAEAKNAHKEAYS